MPDIDAPALGIIYRKAKQF